MKATVTISEPGNQGLLKFNDMPNGSFGVIEETPLPLYKGCLVLKVRRGCVFAFNSGDLWFEPDSVETLGGNNRVRLLAPGTKVTLLVNEEEK